MQKDKSNNQVDAAEAAGSEYKEAGLNYELIQPFKDRMVEVGKLTRAFPNLRALVLR